MDKEQSKLDPNSLYTLLKKAENERMAELRNRTPEDWMILIKKIENEPLRIRVACLVFWDFYGREQFKENTRSFLPDFGETISAWKPEMEKEISLLDEECALVKIGYPKRLAEIRVRQGNEEKNENAGTRAKRGCYGVKR